jgi:subtilase family serine protease
MRRARPPRCLAGWAAAALAVASMTGLAGASAGFGGAATASGPATAGAGPVWPPGIFRAVTASGPGGGYTPGQLRAAYGVASLLGQGVNGSGQTIAIVDPFGSPTIKHDLGVFDKQFGLPTNLKIIQPEGPVSKTLPSALSRAWAAETTLDVEWAHAMAPDAKILLAETPASATESTFKFVQTITKAVRYIVSHALARVISESLDVTEQNLGAANLAKLSTAYSAARSHQVTVVAAAGDTGPTNYRRGGTTLYLHRVVAWPASDPLVTAVGGTDVQLNASGGRTAPDTVWSEGNQFAGGGGRSVIFARPAYQNRVSGIVGANRGVPDVAMSAGCDPGVDIYHSYSGSPGWAQACGTSESTPLMAAVVALADQVAGHPLGLINPALYKLAAAHSAGITQITSGDNTVTFKQGGTKHTVVGFHARAGYSLAAGVGTVAAAALVHELG